MSNIASVFSQQMRELDHPDDLRPLGSRAWLSQIPCRALGLSGFVAPINWPASHLPYIHEKRPRVRIGEQPVLKHHLGHDKPHRPLGRAAPTSLAFGKLTSFSATSVGIPDIGLPLCAILASTHQKSNVTQNHQSAQSVLASDKRRHLFRHALPARPTHSATNEKDQTNNHRNTTRGSALVS